MKVGDCMNVWRSLHPGLEGMQWSDEDAWFDRDIVNKISSNVERDHEDIRRVAVIRIKSIKEK